MQARLQRLAPRILREAAPAAMPERTDGLYALGSSLSEPGLLWDTIDCSTLTLISILSCKFLMIGAPSARSYQNPYDRPHRSSTPIDAAPNPTR